VGGVAARCFIAAELDYAAVVGCVDEYVAGVAGLGALKVCQEAAIWP